MKIAASNIAWPNELQNEVIDGILGVGVTAIEIAPTKLFPNVLEVSHREIQSTREFWSSNGLPIVAAQSLLFGKPELQLFKSAESRNALREYLGEVVKLCGELGAKSLVFGSPKNRRVDDLDRNDAWNIAIDFFRDIGEVAVRANTALVIESNPAHYGADFITTFRDADKLVRDVSHPGVLLHLDSACLKLASELPTAVNESNKDLIRHVHASEPDLGALHGIPDDAKAFHRDLARNLSSIGYNGWISLEMRQQGAPVADLIRSLKEVKDLYQPN